jgi:hypothetical protein
MRFFSENVKKIAPKKVTEYIQISHMLKNDDFKSGLYFYECVLTNI